MWETPEKPLPVGDIRDTIADDGGAADDDHRVVGAQHLELATVAGLDMDLVLAEPDGRRVDIVGDGARTVQFLPLTALAGVDLDVAGSIDNFGIGFELFLQGSFLFG